MSWNDYGTYQERQAAYNRRRSAQIYESNRDLDAIVYYNDSCVYIENRHQKSWRFVLSLFNKEGEKCTDITRYSLLIKKGAVVMIETPKTLPTEFFDIGNANGHKFDGSFKTVSELRAKLKDGDELDRIYYQDYLKARKRASTVKLAELEQESDKA